LRVCTHVGKERFDYRKVISRTSIPLFTEMSRETV
jgi:hypothetical protein